MAAPRGGPRTEGARRHYVDRGERGPNVATHATDRRGRRDRGSRRRDARRAEAVPRARPSAVHIAPLSVHSNVGPSEMLIRSAVTGVTVICQRRLPGGASRLALVAARVKPD